ncbi:uncharacterized protein Z520_02411 [Fonsecaea multimorphosa CBS 102226]|uniref:Major facilitator superfamily (MFS) profile domain-containing protein n=1 Tax=Fonsecaea multimorphosa CBS 102226 TaxID=1442371 RepID=A0A0D2K867_9EURO|nr:uncharacterized protein Z520_02411 [Fonsecaea multimorphosa CBS 102226]KIY02273.1 hypothetical protein Z520_02411 [Fonsecaea multimorphosa CBS 102226]OAL28921.1 hypothetical protein AYO22_02357 [Fonsecaea multimorphosa]
MHSRMSDGVAQVEHYHGRQFRTYNILMLVIMAVGSFGFGYTNACMSTVLVQPSFIQTFNLDTRSNANDLIGMTNSLYFAGGFFGSLSSCFCSDKWGRRWGIAVPCLISTAAAALLAGSVDISMFIVFRFVQGVAAFTLLAAIPVWMSEVAPPSIRGALVNIHNFALLIGYSVSGFVGYGFFHIHNSRNIQWRGIFALLCIPNVLLLAVMYWIPESPRWLLLHERVEEAEKTLHRLHSAEEARIELIQIQCQLQIDRHLQSTYLSMFTKPSYRKRTIMAFCLTCAIQICGPLVIAAYSPTIYGLLGFDANKQILYTAGFFTVSIGGSLMSLFIVQVAPRPLNFAVGIILSLACLSVEAALVANYATTPESLAHPNHAALKAAAAMFFVFIVFLEATLGGTQYVYIGELFPTHIRSKGMAIGTSGLSFMNTIWLQAAPTAFRTIGWKFYLCFICPGTVAAILILLLYPDTRGLPLESVAALFGDEVGDNIVQAHEIKINTDDLSQSDQKGVIGEKEQPRAAVSLEHIEKTA